MSKHFRFSRSLLAALFLCGLAAAQTSREKPASAEDYFRQGLEKSNSRRCAEAVKDFDRAIALNPIDAAYYKARGECFLAAKETNKALADVNNSLRLKTDYAEAYLVRGKIYFEEFLSKGDAAGYREKTLADFAKSIALDPLCAECYFTRSQLHFWTRGTADVIFADLDKAVALDPGNKQYRLFRFSLNFAIENYEKCVADSDAMIKLNAQDADAFYMRGQSYFALGDYQKAVGDYSRALEMKPITAAVFLEQRAKAYRALGKIEEAEADEKKLRTLRGQ